MKIIPALFILLTVNFIVTAQTSQQQKIDSVCQLVKKYMNEKAVDKLYQLTGGTFHNQISPETFKSISEGQFFPLGEIKETIFEGYANGIGRYKAVFPSGALTLILRLDPVEKLEVFALQPYKDENARKTYKVPFSNPLLTPLDNKVNEIALSYIMQQNTVGVSIGILKEGKTYFYGYGETAKGNKTIPDSVTIFEIGSVSKTFTATLLTIAVGEGKVTLRDPVNKYLPDSIPLLQYNNRVATLAELSNHTSAIPRMPSNFQSTVVDAKDPFSSYSVEKLYSFLKHVQLTREPGKQYEYSNAAVGLLGTLLQKIYRQSYEQLILHYICNPLAMTDTRQFILKNDSSRFAKGYNENGEYNPPWNLESSFAGAGAIRSSARDLLKYADANLGNARGSLGKAIQLTHDTTFSNGQVSIGLGWHYIPAGEVKVLFHNGETGGYRTYLAINTHTKFAVVILSNCTIDPDGAGNALMSWLEKN